MSTVLIGQYTYTACETPGPYSSVPGWKVKQVQSVPPFAELPEAAVKAAVRPFGRYRTPAIGPLTTQAEIDQLPGACDWISSPMAPAAWPTWRRPGAIDPAGTPSSPTAC